MHKKIIDSLIYSRPADWFLYNYRDMVGGSYAFWNWSMVRNTKQDLMRDSLFCFPMMAREYSNLTSELGVESTSFELTLAIHFSYTPFGENDYRYTNMELKKRSVYRQDSMSCSVAKVFMSVKEERLRSCLARDHQDARSIPT